MSPTTQTEPSAPEERRRLRGDAGISLLIVGLGMVVLLAIAALVVDIGNAAQQKRQLQNATDTAALAAAAELGVTEGCPAEAAVHYALDNLDLADEAAGSCTSVSTTVDGTSLTVSTPYADGPAAYDPATLVHVELCRDVPTGFARIVNADSIHICASSTARRTETESSEAPGGVADPIRFPKNPSCAGSPTVDGRVTGAESYVKIGNLAVGAKVYGDILFACTDDQYQFAMRLNGLSTEQNVANENIYGDGDYLEEQGTGWEKHNFGALEGSDRARFRVSCGSDAVHDFVQDYLRDEDGTWVSDADGDGELIEEGPAESSSAMVYNLLNPEATGWGDSPIEEPFEQSPPFTPAYPTVDPQFAGWEYQVTYEFAVPRSSYQTCPASPGLFFAVPPFDESKPDKGGVHNSPSKDDDGGSVFSETETASDVALVE